MGFDALPEWTLPERIQFLIGAVSQSDPGLAQRLAESRRVAQERISHPDSERKQYLVALYVESWIVKSRLYGLLDIMYPYPNKQNVKPSELSRMIECVEFSDEPAANGRRKLNFNMYFSDYIGGYASEVWDNFVGDDLAALRETAMPSFLRERIVPDLLRFGGIVSSVGCEMAGCHNSPSTPDYRISCGYNDSKGLEKFTIDAKLSREKIGLTASQNELGLPDILYLFLWGLFKKMQTEYTKMYAVFAH